MMAAIIFVVSLATLLQFFVSYCRSLVAASARQPLSSDVQKVTGISTVATGRDFAKVMQFLYLCPSRPEDRGEVRSVHIYFALLNLFGRVVAKIIPAAVLWIERERGRCAYFAAVALDRRIAFSREMLAEQMEN
ncbi:MAG: hypothetical protein PVS2B2_11700 [Candidatus Acidiferrum sp.]